MSDDNHDKGSQADELTEMWDAASLREAGLDMDGDSSGDAGKTGPATAGAAREEPSIQIAIPGATSGAAKPQPQSLPKPSPKKKKKRKKKGLDALGLPAQIGIAVAVAVGTFLIVRLLIS